MAMGKSAKTVVTKPKTRRKKTPEPVVREVWARAGGICAFPGCPLLLYVDPATRSKKNFGEVAHNVAAMPGGERGHPKRSKQLSEDPENLILLCPTHHRLIDKRGAAAEYPDSLLAMWKKTHESAIVAAGTLTGGALAHALLFQGVIGNQPAGMHPRTVPLAMFQQALVPEKEPLHLTLDPSIHPAKSSAYWGHSIAEVRARVTTLQRTWGNHKHSLALFALADMPTLMALGLAIGHTVALTVFQFDPVPGNGGDWRFPDLNAPAPDYRVKWPDDLTGHVAVVISLSGTIERNRVINALPVGPHSIVEITIPTPTTNLVRSPKAIDEFGRIWRDLVAQLETKLPKTTPIHVFPAMPASLAVTLGRHIKPKVSFSFQIYDAQDKDAPFAPAITLPFLD